MKPPLDRVVLRVPHDFTRAVRSIAAQVFEETATAPHRAAVFRGLIAIGLAKVAETEILAPLFANTAIPRGRKKVDRDP